MNSSWNCQLHFKHLAHIIFPSHFCSESHSVPICYSNKLCAFAIDVCVIVNILPFAVIYVCILLSFAFTLMVNSHKCTEFNESSLGNMSHYVKERVITE